MSVGGPLIEPVETFGANVAGEDPEHGRLESQIKQASARRRYQRDADAASPVVGFDVESVEFAEAGDVGIASWSRSGEAMDHASVGRHDGVGMKRVRVAERIFGGAIFRAKLIEVVIGHEVAVGGLPGAHMDARDCHGIGRLGGAKQHG